MCHRIVVYRNLSVYILGNDCQRLGKLLQDKFTVAPWASGSPQSKSDFNPSILMIKFSTIAFRTLPLSIQVHHSIFMHLQLCCMCMHTYIVLPALPSSSSLPNTSAMLQIPFPTALLATALADPSTHLPIACMFTFLHAQSRF